MAKYKVTVSRTDYFEIEVEARGHVSARSIAIELFNNMDSEELSKTMTRSSGFESYISEEITHG